MHGGVTNFLRQGGGGYHFLILLHFFLRDSTTKGEFQCFRCLYQNQKFKKSMLESKRISEKENEKF